MVPSFAVSHAALDAAAVTRAARAAAGAVPASEGIGAVVTFEGVVRATNQGRTVLRLDYEGYDGMIVKVFEQIGAEIDVEWPGARAAIHHRLGTLDVGEVSIVIATASAHRAAAYAANRYAIERVKQIAPIWKHEHIDGGDVWVEGAPVGVDDEAARRKALAIACA